MVRFRLLGIALIWYAIFAPVQTPPDIQAKLGSAIVGAVESPEVQARFESLSMRPTRSTQAQLAARMKAEIERWGETVRKANIPLQD